MNFSDISVAMIRKSYILGNNFNGTLHVRAGVFYTDKSNMYIDANIYTKDNVVSAKLELLDTHWHIYILKGCNTGYEASDFINKNINNFKTN